MCGDRATWATIRSRCRWPEPVAFRWSDSGESVNTKRVRPLLGCFLTAFGVLGLLNASAPVRSVLDASSHPIVRVASAWGLVASLVYLTCGIAALRRALWPWPVLVVESLIQIVVVATRTVLEPAAGIWSGVQALAVLANVGWLWVLFRPSVRDTFRPQPFEPLGSRSRPV